MRVYCLTSLDELTPYADDWERLAAGLPFRGWSWLSNWWRHYGPQNDAETLRTRLATLCVFDNDDTLVGIAPWYLDCSALRGRVLRPLGSGEVCSEYLGILCHPGREEAVVESLADFLLQNAFDDDPDALRWDLLDLDYVDADNREVSALVDHLSTSDCLVHRRQGMNCWRLELSTDWERYLASLPRKLRSDIRHLERDLLNTGRAVLRRVQRLDELPKAMDIIVDLHQRRRKSLGEAGCFASARFLGFFRDVVPDLLRRGQLQFYWLELDGKPVAAEYQLVGNGIVYSYQAGVDPAAMEHQPGKMINAAILRQAIAGGYRGFDFLRGDEPYKARFAAKPRPTVHFRVAPRRPAARLRHNLWVAGRNVKDWMKTMMKEAGSPEVPAMNK
ncbi:MAG: GNAT family N-acetyltransferase [Thermoguttaceae bacterium]|jgi:CelD/BcsL family acetyltransferase involved in cellulose biosynthesis